MADNNNLSPEERDVNKLINEAKAQIAEIEKELSDLPKEHGPRLEYNMPGGPQRSAEAKNAEINKAGQERIAGIKNDLAERVDKTLSNSSKDVKEKGNKNLTSFLYPGEADKNHSGEKTLDASQEFAMKLRYEGKEKDTSVPAHERAQLKDLDASQDFAMKLRYDNKPIDPPKDQKTPEKNMSMSIQFEQTLEYPKTGLDDRSDEDKTEDKSDKDPDKDKDE